MNIRINNLQILNKRVKCKSGIGMIIKIITKKV